MKNAIVLLRVLIGVLFFYAGFSKIINPEWTAAGFLSGAQTFAPVYQWFASETNIVWVNFLNQWGLTAVGLSMISGLLVRPAAIGGIALMVLYYFPSLDFPYVDHGFLVDDHLIYAAVFYLLFKENAGRYYGLDGLILKKKK